MTQSPIWFDVAAASARELMRQGGMAVVLMGSYARGDARAESDLDLYALGEGPGYELARKDGFLISTTWMTADTVRAAFNDPATLVGLIPGWQTARILADPANSASSIIEEARNWTWEQIGEERLNAWVAQELHGWTEEIHKFLNARATGDSLSAAIQRSVLALRLAYPLCVHHRLLPATENILWEAVGQAMGPEWQTTQRRALGLGGESLEVTAQAALELFGLACVEIWPLFNERQREVVRHVCQIAGLRIDKTGKQDGRMF